MYLNCCRGGAADAEKVPVGRLSSLTEALAHAGVPEELSFIWPISDRDSKELAVQFYDSFVSDYDAVQALYRARKRLDRNKRLWAAPILIQQITPGNSPDGTE